MMKKAAQDDIYGDCPCKSLGISSHRKSLIFTEEETARGTPALVLAHTSFILMVSYIMVLLCSKVVKSNFS